MFENFYNELKQYYDDRKVEMVRIVPANSPNFNKSVLVQSIQDIPNMNDSELENFIYHHFEAIINNAYNSSVNYLDYLKWFTDIRFLDVFINTLPRKFLSTDMIVKINKLCYDYMSLDKNDPVIVNRMVKISNTINQVYLPKLLGLGINPKLASYILIARYSHLDLNICIRRVNYILVMQPNNDYDKSYNLISQIFRIIYPDDMLWARIFQYFMFDVIPERNENDLKTHWVTPDVEEINSIINLVILDILNEKPTNVIGSALRNYAESYRLINYGRLVRFSMQRLSGDYDRINYVVDSLKINEQIFVP